MKMELLKIATIIQRIVLKILWLGYPMNNLNNLDKNNKNKILKEGIKILIITVMFSFQSCLNTGDADSCEEIACTEEFKTIVVKIENPVEEPIALDDFKVIHLRNQNDITREFSTTELEQMQATGTYTLFGDEFSDDIQNFQIEIQFIGFVDGQEIVRSDYRVGADCCHVYYVSGDLTLTIE